MEREREKERVVEKEYGVFRGRKGKQELKQNIRMLSLFYFKNKMSGNLPLDDSMLKEGSLGY